MLKQFILYLPCTVCLSWAIITGVSTGGSKSKKHLTVLALLGFMFFILHSTFAGYPIKPENYHAVNIASKAVSLLLFPAGILYILTLTGSKSKSVIVSLMIFPAIFQTGALSVIYWLMKPEVRTEYFGHILAGELSPAGFDDRIFAVHELFSNILFRAFLYILFAISLALLIGYLFKSSYRLGNFRDFIFHNREALLVNTIVGCALMLTACFLICNLFELVLNRDSVLFIIACIIFALLLFIFFYLGSVFDEMTVFWKELFSPKKTWERRYLDSHPEIAEIKRALERSEKKSPKGFSVLNRFVIYVEEHEPFLESGFSLEQAADSVMVDKDRLAKIIKESTGMNFRTYINHKRVEYAKKLMIGDPDAQMNDIAEMSGFTSGSTFSRKFNEIEGIPPTEWLKLEKENNERQ